ncbi:MAG: ankyrin repeat domain-containing protein [Candidatus Omnitrophica bacterium]|nr:ankyrin repeat domain-containing protein [Candidatus Omnitrophota bacterium]
MFNTLVSIIVCIFITASNGYCQYSSGNLFSAARNGEIKTVDRILGEKPSQESLNMVLGAAVTGDQIELIKHLITKGADVNHVSSYNNNILINAIMFDRPRAAKVLIENKADVNVKGFRNKEHGIYITWFWTPLMCAARKGNLDLVKLLIEKKADINETGWSQSSTDKETAIDIAAYSGNTDIYHLLHKKGARLSPFTIFKVIRGGKLEVLKLILDDKISADSVEPVLGRTLIAEASWWNYPRIVEFLIQKKADVNLPDKEGISPLMHAARRNNLDIIKILFKNGADINQKQGDGTTPFLYARDNGLNDILNIFRE